MTSTGLSKFKTIMVCLVRADAVSFLQDRGGKWICREILKFDRRFIQQYLYVNFVFVCKDKKC